AVLARRERPWRLGYCGSSAGAEHGKPAALVRPMLYVAKARLGEQVAEFLGRVLIRVLGMNALAGGKAPPSCGPAYEHIALRLQEHLDARVGFIVVRHVGPVIHLEVAAQQLVYVSQQVEIECGGQSQRVVIGRLEYSALLETVDSHQQAPAGAGGADA